MLLSQFRKANIQLPKTQFDRSVHLEYLGTAGFVFSSSSRTLVVDPFVSRPSLLETACFPLKSDAQLLQSIIPKADDVLVGHAHHDHILDAPQLCKHTGARFIGSEDSCRIARAAGVSEEQILETSGREKISCGDSCIVEGLPSLHGRVYFNRVTLPGKVAADFQWPARFWHFRHGQVLNWHIDINGLKIVHIDSAEFIEEELQGKTADILCLCAIGRRWRPNYVRDAVRLVQPKLVIACHWDWFFTPYEGPHYLLPDVDINGFVNEIEEAGCEAAVLPIGAQLSL